MRISHSSVFQVESLERDRAALQEEVSKLAVELARQRKLIKTHSRCLNRLWCST